MFDGSGSGMKIDALHQPATWGPPHLNGQLGKYIGRVKRWMDSDQRQRWVTMAILEVETKMRRIDRPENLQLLRQALLQRIPQKQQDGEQEEPFAEKIFNQACFNPFSRGRLQALPIPIPFTGPALGSGKGLIVRKGSATKTVHRIHAVALYKSTTLLGDFS